MHLPSDDTDSFDITTHFDKGHQFISACFDRKFRMAQSITIELTAEAKAEGGRVLVHCAANYRVTSFMALYAEMKLGWTREQADALARTFWPLNDTWADFLGKCRDEVLEGRA